MPKDTFSYESIGVIRTPFESPEGMPIQPIGADSVTGTVEIDASYADGLADLAEFSHCILLYHFHASSDDAPLRVEPFLDDERRVRKVGKKISSCQRLRRAHRYNASGCNDS